MIISTCTKETHLAQLELIEQVFHPRMRDRYPWLLGEANLVHRFVALERQKVIGALSYWIDEVVIEGHYLRVASIGAVATHPDYRHQGIASKLLEHAEQVMRQEKIDVVIISGAIDLYLRYGADRLSRVRTFEIPPGTDPITVVPFRHEDLTAIKAMHDANPARFVRSLVQMQQLIEATTVPSNWMDTSVVTVLNPDQPVAYAVVTRRPNKPGAWIREFGGDPAVLEALSGVLHRSLPVDRVILELIHNDPLILNLDRNLWVYKDEPMESTIKVLDFEALIRKLKPLLIQRDPNLTALSVKQRGDKVKLSLHGAEYSTTARMAQRLLFGPWPDDIPLDHPVLQQLKGINPIPWVYDSTLNYQ